MTNGRYGSVRSRFSTSGRVIHRSACITSSAAATRLAQLMDKTLVNTDESQTATAAAAADPATDPDVAGSDRRLAGDAGMSTAEYAVGTIAAVAFAAVLYKIVQSPEVHAALAHIIANALNFSL